MNAHERPYEGSASEAYSRVTNPERFRPLHRLAIDLVEHLAAEYAVRRSEDFHLLPGMVPFHHARLPVTLSPVLPNAAPISVAFTPFPSLVVRFGRWIGEPFPSCACDACAATADGEGVRLHALVDDVVAGRFREEISIPLFGSARLGWSFGGIGGTSGRQSGWRGISRDHALVLRGQGSGVVHWSPWPGGCREQ
jgi:hypothetical protein